MEINATIRYNEEDLKEIHSQLQTQLGPVYTALLERYYTLRSNEEYAEEQETYMCDYCGYPHDNPNGPDCNPGDDPDDVCEHCHCKMQSHCFKCDPYPN